MDFVASKFIEWTVILFLYCHPLVILCETQLDYPEGYYAFEEATPLYKRPPKVRKPPYYKADVSCPGQDPIGRFSPRDTLCGDLNKGFIPRSPIEQTPFGEPYPFDVIRNKTLKFLSKLLPFLKQNDDVPKVARFVGAPVSYREPGGFDYHQIPLHYNRQRRSATKERTNTSKPVDTKARGLCDDRAGIFCSMSNALQNNKVPLAVLTALAEALSNTKTTTTTTTPKPEFVNNKRNQLLSLLASVAENSLKAPTKIEKLPNDEDSKDRSPFSHLMSLITGASTDNFNPVSLMIDLVASNNSPFTYLSNLFPSRRRRPPGGGISSNTVIGETNKIETGLPPTPCPSIEDYVTPTFARNYQGVWKYVVQIPKEGYFTQTVQQTKCVTNRCDFMDGVCHESPRWVSLLVAEVFYPNTYFPTSTPLTTPLNIYDNEIPPIEDFHNFQQYLKRRVGESENPQPQHSTYFKAIADSKETCDGYDQIGCFILRVYYDWFLVNGSCKCWKPSARQLFESKASKKMNKAV